MDLTKKQIKVNLTIDQLFKVRLHLGHKHNKLDLSVLPFIEGKRHQISIFNLEKTLISLRLSYKSISEIVKQRGHFFLIGTNQNLPMNELFYYFLNKYSLNNKNETHFFIRGFIGSKWIGGIFSNWRSTLNIIKFLKKQKKIKRSKNYKKILQGINKIEYNALPDFVFSFNGDNLALNEIQQLNIPIIGINDSNVNANSFLYNLMGNDDSIESIQFFCSFLEKAIKEGKRMDQERFFIFCLKSLKLKIEDE